MKYLSPNDAAKVAGVSRIAVMYWIKKHRIAEQVSGRWQIDPQKLDEIVQSRATLKSRQPVES